MCCGLWLAKRDKAAGGSRKIADKGMQIKAGMENVEEDIAQEGNANKGKALRWCLRNREARIYIYTHTHRERRPGKKGGKGVEMETERGFAEARRESEKESTRQDERVEGWSMRMVSRRSLAVWHPYSANYHYKPALVGLHEVASESPALISQHHS